MSTPSEHDAWMAIFPEIMEHLRVAYAAGDMTRAHPAIDAAWNRVDPAGLYPAWYRIWMRDVLCRFQAAGMAAPRADLDRLQREALAEIHAAQRALLAGTAPPDPRAELS